MPHDPHRPNPACLELFEKLSLYIDGEADPLTMEKIEAHADGCIQCAVCLETLKQTVALCKSIPVKPAPVDFSERLGKVFSAIIRKDTSLNRKR